MNQTMIIIQKEITTLRDTETKANLDRKTTDSADLTKL